MALSDHELELVIKLRNRVADVVPAHKLEDDHFLVRWLRARDLDLKKAEIMLRKSMKWRKENEMDTILDFPPTKINNHRLGIAGHDDEGCIVLIVPLGLWNVHELKAKEINPSLRYYLWILARIIEEFEKSSKRLGKPVTQLVAIFDYQKVNSFRCMQNRHLLKLGLAVGGLFEANFPEILKTVIIVNTPSMYPWILKIAKPFLSSKTMSKIEINSPERKKWIESIRQKIPKEILPPYYGGTRPGIDEYCSDDTSLWGCLDGADDPLPANFFGARECSTLTLDRDVQMEDDFKTDDGKWKSEEIKAGSQLDLQFTISQEMCSSKIHTLKWSIKSEGYDIGMKVTLIPEGQNLTKDIVEFRRVDSHLKPHTGSLVCKTPGVYILVLDNSYSKRRSKVISYKAYLDTDGITQAQAN